MSKMSSFIIVGTDYMDKVMLHASSCVHGMSYDQQEDRLGLWGSNRTLSYMAQYQMKIDLCAPLTVTAGNQAEAWTMLMEKWQPPEAQHLATAILLGKSPEKPSNPFIAKTWLPGDSY